VSHIKNLNTPDDDATEVDATPWISRRALLRAGGILAGVGASRYTRRHLFPDRHLDVAARR